ncbi:putative ribosomal N-acetyltransferase YdaF [Clostridiales bacterium]|nr:putative ribosomal N-acetyltransferase YdaF [Clostridiales bacterium]
MKCKIRQWRFEDASDLAVAINNPNVQNNLRDGIPYPYTKNDAAEFIELMLNSDKNTIPFAIEYYGKVVGSIAVYRGDNIHFRTGEIGYYIGEDYWGLGITTDAVSQICSYIFNNTDIIRIFAEPFSYNIASCKILEKNGFKQEGILRKNAFKNGNIYDMVLYSLVKE